MILMISENLNIFIIITLIFATSAGLIPISLFINYRHNCMSKIVFNTESKIIKIEYQKNYEIINFTDIESVEIYRTERRGLVRLKFDYARYYLINGKNFVVNSLMTNTFFIPDKITPIETDQFYPLIKKNNKRLKTDYQYLFEKYRKLENDELDEIINSEKYRESAVLAAKNILLERKKRITKAI